MSRFQPTSIDQFLARKNGLIVILSDEQLRMLNEGEEVLSHTLAKHPVKIFLARGGLFAKTAGSEGVAQVAIELRFWNPRLHVYRAVPVLLIQDETA